jgi:glycosyltransferase involved in cell wall biosynthesis
MSSVRVNTAAPQVTVLIPTRDRPEELRRCLAAIVGCPTRCSYEIIVIDDGSLRALTPYSLGIDTSARFRVLRCDGIGPARARNVGISKARAPVVLFTDDDTIPCQGWVDEASDFLSTHPDYIGVEGPTTSPPYDPLYFHSVRSMRPGGYLTCNIAYRANALRAVGGFAEEFPFPHGEDLDLGIRITRLGTLGYTETMNVLHPPRPAGLYSQIRKGRIMASDATLFEHHPDSYPRPQYLSGAGYALALNAKRWLHSALRDGHRIRGNPWRVLRFVTLAVGYTIQGVAALIGRSLR